MDRVLRLAAHDEVMGNAARLFEIIHFRTNGCSLKGKRILDYECGWGRLLRLMYYFSDPDHVYGIDPWDRSLEVCRDCGIVDNVALCESVPSSLPFADVQFDFAFSFSVFTHLSEPAARALLRATRDRIAPGGIYVVTIRPVEFWSVRRSALGDTVYESMVRQHSARGFAFMPPPFTGEKNNETYGETSISFEFMRAMARQEGWNVVAFDREMMEPYQVLVALSPAKVPKSTSTRGE